MTAAPITPDRLQPLEHYCSSYGLAIPHGVTLEDVLEPAYWAHCANKLRLDDIIRLIPEDRSYFAEAWVLATGTGFAKLMLLRRVDRDGTEDLTVPEELEVKWRGPHSMYSIVRRSDGAVLKDQIKDKGDAMRAAVGYKLAA